MNKNSEKQKGKEKSKKVRENPRSHNPFVPCHPPALLAWLGAAPGTRRASHRLRASPEAAHFPNSYPPHSLAEAE